MMLTELCVPEAVVVLNVLIQLWNDGVLGLPRRLVVWKISPLDEVPQRIVLHQSTYNHNNISTILRSSLKSLTIEFL